MTVLGTRPEIIRLSLIIKRLDEHSDHVLVHTGQNFDDRLSGVFFQEFGLRQPDIFLNIRGGSFGEQVAQLLTRIEPIFLQHRPDRLLILGDTNSGLCSIVARRLGIPVFHMEAGNRCFDFRVPEEGNRRIIDHLSSVLMPYTQRSRENLIREGIAADNIHVTGNPIKEVIDHYRENIDRSDALAELELEPGRFFLVTMHRAENVDIEARLRSLLQALTRLQKQYGMPLVVSLHPRTRSKAQSFGIDLEKNGVKFLEPLGFFDFISLEQSAFCLLSDSGTVQEEGCIFRVPNVTIRDVTERPETIDCGSNVLSGCDPEMIVRLVGMVTAARPNWQPPVEYLANNVCKTVCNIVLGYRVPNISDFKN